MGARRVHWLQMHFGYIMGIDFHWHDGLGTDDGVMTEVSRTRAGSQVRQSAVGGKGT